MYKKITKILISIALLMVLIPNISVYAMTSEDYLREMIELRDGSNMNEEAAEEIITALSKIDVNLIELVYNNNVKIILTGMDGTLLEEYEEADITAGHSYEAVPGFYMASTKLVFVRLNDDLDESIRTALHEFGHAIDYAMGGFIASPYSDNDEVRTLIENEKQVVFPLDVLWLSDYGDAEPTTDIPEGLGYLDQEEEYIAAAFESFYIGEKSIEDLKENGPETFKFIEKLPFRILTPSSYTNSEMTITWIPHESVATYQIYRNGERIDTVAGETSEYTLRADEIEAQKAGHLLDYEFSFIAQGESGEALFTSSIADTRKVPVDVSNLEALIAEAKTLQTLVPDGAEDIELAINFVSYDLVRYEDEDPRIREKVYQSSILNAEYYLKESLQFFEEAVANEQSAESESESESESDEAPEINDEESDDGSSKISIVLVAVGIVFIVGIFLIIHFLRRKKNNTKQD